MAIVYNNTDKNITLRHGLLDGKVVIPARGMANIDDYFATLFFGYKLPEEDKQKFIDIFLSRLMFAGNDLTKEDFLNISFEESNVSRKLK